MCIRDRNSSTQAHVYDPGGHGEGCLDQHCIPGAVFPLLASRINALNLRTKLTEDMRLALITRPHASAASIVSLPRALVVLILKNQKNRDTSEFVLRIVKSQDSR